MVLVRLEDGTSYCIDTDCADVARDTVQYKLRDRLDYRKITDTEVFKGTKIHPNSPYYNSWKCRDGKELRCKTGTAYKWNKNNSTQYSEDSKELLERNRMMSCIKEFYTLLSAVAENAKNKDLSLIKPSGIGGCDGYQGMPPICRALDEIYYEYEDIVYESLKENPYER